METTRPPFAIQLDHINAICAAAIADLHKEPAARPMVSRSPRPAEIESDVPSLSQIVRNPSEPFFTKA